MPLLTEKHGQELLGATAPLSKLQALIMAVQLVAEDQQETAEKDSLLQMRGETIAWRAGDVIDSLNQAINGLKDLAVSLAEFESEINRDPNESIFDWAERFRLNRTDRRIGA